MNQTESYLKWAMDRGGVVTLGDILSSGRWSAEYRRYHTEIRNMGYEVIVKRNSKNPSQNVYSFKRGESENFRLLEETVLRVSSREQENSEAFPSHIPPPAKCEIPAFKFVGNQEVWI